MDERDYLVYTMSFTNKVVLIFGACSGIGASAAIHFAKEDADVVLVGRNMEKLYTTADICKKYGKTPFIIKADISIDYEVVMAVDATVKKFRKLDILINNTGIAADGSILDGNLLQCYDNTMRTNLRGLIHVTQLAAPHLIKTKGNIVNVSSIAATTTPIHPKFICFAVSKAGVNQFTRGAAAELAPHGVRVNAVSPGPVKTDFTENNGFENFIEIKLNIPLNRISEPDEVAELILFLASDKAKSITGSIYVTDNGCSLTRS